MIVYKILYAVVYVAHVMESDHELEQLSLRGYHIYSYVAKSHRFSQKSH